MIIQNGWQDESKYAIIASGMNYPDALSAAPLAKLYNAPIILTDNNTLNENAIIELKRLNTKIVYLIGGEGVISKNVEQSIKAMNIECIRICGNDRYETSVEIAKQLPYSKKIFLVNADNYCDALSIAPLAAKNGEPILLTEKDQLPKCVLDYINSRKIDDICVIGDNNLISDDSLIAFKNVIRIYGNDTYERNINILNKHINTFNLNTVFIASGENFPDALAATALAANDGSPILLISNEKAMLASNFIKNHIYNIKNIVILGGDSILPLNMLKDELGTIVNYPHKDNLNNVISISSNSNIVQGNYIYYSCINKNDANGLYKVDLDNKNKKCIDMGEINGFYIDKDLIYYNNSGKLYTIKPDGSNKTQFLPDYISFFEIRGNYIYYCDSKGIFKIKKDKTESYNLAIGYIDSVIISGNYLYYNISTDKKIHKVDINGNNGSVVHPHSIYLTKIDNNNIYFREEMNGPMFKINKDGTHKSKVTDIKDELSSDFYITYMFPNDGDTDVYLKFGYLDIVFSENTIRCGELSRITLVDEEGNYINIKEAVPGMTAKNNFLIIPESRLKRGKSYTLLLLKGTIQSENGEYYNKNIYITFKMGN